MKTEQYTVWKRTESEIELRISTLKTDCEHTQNILKELQKEYSLWREKKGKGIHTVGKTTKGSLQRLSELYLLQQQEVKEAEKELLLLQKEIRKFEQEQQYRKRQRSVLTVGGILMLFVMVFFVTQYAIDFTESGSQLTGAVISLPEINHTETKGSIIAKDSIALAKDVTTIPSPPTKGFLKKNKTLDELINETSTQYPKERIKEIKQTGYTSEEIIFNDKEEKALLIHEPRFDGKGFAEAIPLEAKDDFTYNLAFEGTAIEIAFDSPEIKDKKQERAFQQSNESTSDSWKIKYDFLLPEENFTARVRISSNSPIIIGDALVGEMNIGQFSLNFKAEYDSGYAITTEQATENIVFVYLAKNYSADGKNVNDLITIDPTLTVGSAIRTRVCGNVLGFDTIDVQNGGVLEICPQNTTNQFTSGWVNFSLGYFGNFSVSPTGMVEGKGSGGIGGIGCGASGCTGRAGWNGTGYNGTGSTTPNGGGGSGATKVGISDSAGGSGGGFGGAGGRGGISASGTLGNGGLTYGGTNGDPTRAWNSSERLYIGSGGGGSAGDEGTQQQGGSGGGGIKVEAGAGGMVFIRGAINVSGKNGTAPASGVDRAGSGAGSGGHVILKAGKIIFSSSKIEADGAKGGNVVTGQTDACPGGGSGGGRLVYVYETIASSSFTNTTLGGSVGVGSDAACDFATDALGGKNGSAGTVFYNQTTFNKLPAMYLVSPANLTTETNDNTPVFTFNVSDDMLYQSFLNCTLWINSIGTALPYGTNNTVFNRTSTNITANASLSNGVYTWWINCSDGLETNMERSNISEVRNFTMNIAGPPDTNPPNVTSLTPALNARFNWSTAIEIAATVNDSSPISVVRINVTYPNNSIQVLELANSSGAPSRFNISFLIPVTGLYTINFSANDSLNNLNRTEFTNFTASNAAPIINFVSNTSIITITEGGITTMTNITFNVTDANGIGDINNLSAKVRVSLAGEADRVNDSCTPYSSFGNTITFNCSVNIWYFDGAGTWTVNVSIEDDSNTYAENRSGTFELLSTTSMTMSPAALTWPTLDLGQINMTSNNDPIIINNTGNKDIASGGVTAEGYNLQGESVDTDFINVKNFTMSVSNGTSDCTGISCFECANPSAIFVNNSARTVGSANITAGNNSIDALDSSSGQETLFVCLRRVPLEIARQTYSTAGAATAQWIISVS